MLDGLPALERDSSSCASRAQDPLGDVISWLDHADLGEDIDGLCSGESPTGARELLSETPSEGTAASTSIARERGVGVRSAPSARLPPAPPPLQSLPAYTGNRAASSSRQGGPQCCWPGIRGETEVRNLTVGVENEDEEWDARQKQTGAAGRLVVYEECERPRDDLLLRGGGSTGRRIMVASVTDDGKAAKAGVKAGDVLVSINGKKDFIGQSADFVHATLRAPVMLVFMGFVGKLQAEVRLNYAEIVAGVPSQHQVVAPTSDATVQLIDEIVFQPSNAPLLIATASEQAQTQAASIAVGFHALPASRGLPQVAPITSVDLDALEFNSGPPVGPIDSEGAFAAREVTVASTEGSDLGRGYSNFQCREDTVNTASTSIMNTSVSQREDSELNPLAVYELRGSEARHLVQRALSRAQNRAALEERYRMSNSKVADLPLMEQPVVTNLAAHNVLGDRAQAPRMIGLNTAPANFSPHGLLKPADIADKVPAKLDFAVAQDHVPQERTENAMAEREPQPSRTQQAAGQVSHAASIDDNLEDEAGCLEHENSMSGFVDDKDTQNFPHRSDDLQKRDDIDGGHLQSKSIDGTPGEV